MKIDFVGTVFIATTRDRAEGATLKGLGGWRWHAGACSAQWCKPGCPAKGMTGWWTTDAAVARRASGEGVHSPASLAAIEAASASAQPAAARPAPSIEYAADRGLFSIANASREQANEIRRNAGGDARWKWHAGECSGQYCRAKCPAAGMTGWWTTDAEAVRPLRAIWGASCAAEMDRRASSAELSRATDADASDLPCPAGKAYLPFQRAGIRYALGRSHVLIADEMGLGKTVQACGIVAADPTIRTVLVIAPAFLRGVWERHAREWATRETRVVVLEDGADVARAKKTDALTRRGDETLWIVVSYGGCRANSAVGKLVHQIPAFDALVLDECHRTKEPDAQQSQGAIALAKRARRVIALTGTPVLNRPIELATTLSMIDPGFNFWSFARRYCAAHQTRFGWDLTGSSHEQELQRRLRETVMIRRLKKQVLRDLPEKSWSIVSLPKDHVPADLLADETCDAAERAEAARMIAEALGDMPAMRDAIEAQLRAMTPAFERSAKTRSLLGELKVEPTLDYLRSLPEQECVLVFTHHKQVARAIYDRLGGEACGIFMSGDVDASERVDLVDQFQSSTDPRFRFVVATIESAKEGLTLTRCTRVVFAEQAWTPGTMAQAEDRAHRIGQTRGVQVDYLVFDGTMDGRLCMLLAKKGRIAQAVLDDTVDLNDAQAEVELSKAERTGEFTAHDLVAMIRRGSRGETNAQRAQRAVASRGVTASEGDAPTRAQVEAMLACMRTLADCDSDRASEKNGEGFAKSDVSVGHAIAALDAAEITPEIFALGAAIARRYRGQLGDEAIAALSRR